MDRINDVYEELEGMKAEIEARCNKIRRRCRKAPAGMLRCSRAGSRYQYYHKTDPGNPHGCYIPNDNRIIAERLAQKDYDLKLLKILQKQLSAIDRFLKHYDPDAAVKVYEQLSKPRKQLVTPEFMTDDEYVKQWLGTPYQKLGFRPNEPEYYTLNNERVRSKSEIIIANTLRSNNIPYRYEFPVYSDGILIAAPDFNCLNVRTRKEYYWEHLGMMGDEAYLNKNIKKIEQYSMAKDFDESRLILTFESDKHPLNTRIIEEKIRRYLA